MGSARSYRRFGNKVSGLIVVVIALLELLESGAHKVKEIWANYGPGLICGPLCF